MPCGHIQDRGTPALAVREDCPAAARVMSGGSLAASTGERRVATRVGALALADEGTGTPVVLWPSLDSDRRLLCHVQRLLGAGWRTLRIDGPGFDPRAAADGLRHPTGRRVRERTS